MKVYEMISYLQTFNPDAEVKFWAQEELTTKTDVVKNVFFTDDHGYDCETEEQEVDVSLDRKYTDITEATANSEEVVFWLEG